VGLTYAELTRAWRLLEGLQQQTDTPRFTREKLTVEGETVAGEVGPDRVRLTVRYEIGLPAGGKVTVPLGFDGAVLDGPIKIDEKQPGKQFVNYDKQRGGWVAWLTGEAGDRRTIELPLTVPLLRDGDQTLFLANIPRALDASLVIRTAKPIRDAFTSGGALLETTSTDAGGMRLEARGAVGDFRLGWRQAATASQSQPQVVLSVEGQIFTEIDGRTVRSEATLKIESYGGEIERFRVRLPAGATLIPTATGQLTENQPRVTLLSDGVSPEEAAADDPDAGGNRASAQPLCQVTLPERTAGPVTVKIATQQSVGLDDEAETELAGFEVLGAVRQYGDLAIRVADDWRLRLSQLESARRIDLASLPETLQRQGVSAAVRYFQQPWRLAAKVTLPGNRIEATPRYRLLIKPEEAVLTTTILYRIPGARVSGFSIDLHDWSRLDPTPIEPRDLVDNDRADYSQAGRLYVPLKQPASRQARVEFTARRDLSPGDEPLSFRLPVAQATSQGTSELIVVADPAVELIPSAERSQRLRAMPLPPDQRDPADPSGLRTYRFRGFFPNQVFAAEKRLRPGEVDLAISSRVMLQETVTSIRQDFTYTARYEPIDQVLVTAPIDLVTAGALQFVLLPAATPLTEQPATPAAPLSYRPSGSTDVDKDRMVVEVDLPQLRTGEFILRASYEVSGGIRVLDFSDTTEAQLIASWDVAPRSHTLVAAASEGVRLTLARSRNGWSIDSGETSQADLKLSTTSVAPSIMLAPQKEETKVETGATLVRSWRQTWATPSETQQRAVFQFTSQDSQVLVQLPAFFEQDSNQEREVEVLLDGARVVGVQRDGAQLRVPLRTAGSAAAPAAGQAAPQHTLEVRYFEPTTSGLNSVAWRPARLVADETWAQSYWEVVVPAHRHLANFPKHFTPAMAWGAKSGYWGRLPQLDTGDLQRWAGALERAEPTAAENRYLFSYHREAPDDATGVLRIVERRTAVLVCSGLMLALGLALLYLPIMRSAASLLALSVLGVAAGAVYPHVFLLVGQAGLLGLLLAGLAAVISAVLYRPQAADISTATSSLVVQPSSPGTDTLITLPMESVSTNAPTVSAAHQDSSS